MNDVNNFLRSAYIYLYLFCFLMNNFYHHLKNEYSSKNYNILMNDVNDLLRNPNIFCFSKNDFSHLTLFDKNDDPNNCDCHRRKNVLQPINKIEIKMIKKMLL